MVADPVAEEQTVKISRSLYQLKELLGLVIYKGGEKKGQSVTANDSSINASSSVYKIENSTIRTMAVDLSEDR